MGNGLHGHGLLIVGEADAVGQWTGGPAIGALGTVTSIRVALVGATPACSRRSASSAGRPAFTPPGPPPEAVVTTAD